MTELDPTLDSPIAADPAPAAAPYDTEELARLNWRVASAPQNFQYAQERLSFLDAHPDAPR
jgi:hypothetical protein